MSQKRFSLVVRVSQRLFCGGVFLCVGLYGSIAGGAGLVRISEQGEPSGGSFGYMPVAWR